MAWELNADRLVYTQILEIIQTRIISGIYAPGKQTAKCQRAGCRSQV